MSNTPPPNRYDVWILIAAAFAVALVITAATAIGDDGREERESAPVLRVPCEITEVYDGDTVTVRVSLSMRIRLLDCWSHEIRSLDKDRKALGLAARDFLRDQVFPPELGHTSRSAMLSVPLEGMDRFDDAITLGRVLGHVHLLDTEESLADIMRSHGHAYETKQALEESFVDPNP